MGLNDHGPRTKSFEHWSASPQHLQAGIMLYRFPRRGDAATE